MTITPEQWASAPSMATHALLGGGVITWVLCHDDSYYGWSGRAWVTSTVPSRLFKNELIPRPADPRHTCSYHCTVPEHVLKQRDELRERVEQLEELVAAKNARIEEIIMSMPRRGR